MPILKDIQLAGDARLLSLHSISSLKIYADGVVELWLRHDWDLEEWQNAAPPAHADRSPRRVTLTGRAADLVRELMPAIEESLVCEGDLAGGAIIATHETIDDVRVRIELAAKAAASATIGAAYTDEELGHIETAGALLRARQGDGEGDRTPAQKEAARAQNEAALALEPAVNWVATARGGARARINASRKARAYSDAVALEASAGATIAMPPAPPFAGPVPAYFERPANAPADALPTQLARLVPQTIEQAKRKAWLLARYQELTARLVDTTKSFEPPSAAEIAEQQDLERYRGWFT